MIASYLRSPPKPDLADFVPFVLAGLVLLRLVLAELGFLVGGLGAVIVMSGRLSLRAVERQPRHVGGDLLVMMVDRELQLDLRPERREVRADAGDRDVALEHR